MTKTTTKYKRAKFRAKARSPRRGGANRGWNLAIGVIVVVGVALVALTVRSNSSSAAVSPKVGEHWHAYLGVNVCGTWLGNAPQFENQADASTVRAGIHSHGDGVMHWHPGNEQAINRTTGKAAQFKVFLDLYGVELSDSKLSLTGAELNPAGDDVTYTKGKDTCDVNGKPEKASLRTIVWDRYDKLNDRMVHTSNLGHERILKDQQVFVVAFVADSVQNADIPLPKWATDLPDRKSTRLNSSH
mgnify:CR=1 FL=1